MSGEGGGPVADTAQLVLQLMLRLLVAMEREQSLLWLQSSLEHGSNELLVAMQ